MACQFNLKVWDKNCFGHVRNSLQKKLKELQVAKEGGSYRTNPRRIYMLREEIQRLKNREEDRKSTRLNSSHLPTSRMPSSA